MMPKPCIIVTTEKDTTRILELKTLSKGVRENIYFLPIHVEFLQGDDEKFNQIILDYVQKNTRNNRLVENPLWQAT